MLSDKKVEEIMLRHLTPKRYFHSVKVAEKAVYLAEKYGGDPERAKQAALLHDICKKYSEKELLQLIVEYDIILGNIEKNTPDLWHAIAGAEMAARYGLNDQDTINAIRYHTSGRAGMSLLEKIVFIADFVSEDRDYPDVEVIRELSEQSLEVAMKYGVEHIISELEKKKRDICEDTRLLFETLKEMQ